MPVTLPMPMMTTVPTTGPGPVPSPEAFARKAAMQAALGDPVRLQVLWHLCRGEINVTGLCAAIGKRQQAVSHHMMILKLRGLVVLDRRGKNNFYRATPAGRAALDRAWS